MPGASAPGRRKWIVHGQKSSLLLALDNIHFAPPKKKAMAGWFPVVSRYVPGSRTICFFSEICDIALSQLFKPFRCSSFPLATSYPPKINAEPAQGPAPWKTIFLLKDRFLVPCQMFVFGKIFRGLNLAQRGFF